MLIMMIMMEMGDMVTWLHDYSSSSIHGNLSLHDLDNISGYFIPYLIMKFGQYSSYVYKGILDVVV